MAAGGGGGGGGGGGAVAVAIAVLLSGVDVAGAVLGPVSIMVALDCFTVAVASAVVSA